METFTNTLDCLNLYIMNRRKAISSNTSFESDDPLIHFYIWDSV